MTRLGSWIGYPPAMLEKPAKKPIETNSDQKPLREYKHPINRLGDTYVVPGSRQHRGKKSRKYIKTVDKGLDPKRQRIFRGGPYRQLPANPLDPGRKAKCKSHN
jgi:hypothetical protein